jgi:hypothetical protein
VRQDEAAAKLGTIVRRFDIGKRRAFFPFSVGSACGGLSVITVVRSVPCRWIKLCERTVDVWLLSVCKNELLLWKGIESYLYVRCVRVSGPHGLSPRWEYISVGGFVACLISLGWCGLALLLCVAQYL